MANQNQAAKERYKAQFVALYGGGFEIMTRQQKHHEWESAMNMRRSLGVKTWVSPYKPIRAKPNHNKFGPSTLPLSRLPLSR
ncbi:MAG: hypothetical protein COB09_18685 [Thalassobium sp.]|nr:MAG: hypothetical protein COB09_18685 [Thalassobium sp.]